MATWRVIARRLGCTIDEIVGRGPRNAVEMRRGAFGANTELLSLLFSMCVPFYAQPCQKVDERGYRLTYEDKQPRENLREER